MIQERLAAFSLAGIVACAALAGCSGAKPGGLGVRDNGLAPCPATPNCVSSQSRDKAHKIEPLAYATSTTQAMTDLKKVVLGMKRVKIIEEGDFYIRAEFTSALWRFVDDVEFYFDESAKLIQVRSASRLGKSDFGVNRKRVEVIRAAWAEQNK